MRLENHEVSAEHASIYFTGGRWKIRDLASRNGTRVNGQLIEQGVSVNLELNASLQFGQHGQTWSLVDDSPPGARATSESGARAVADGSTLWLPDATTPEAMILAGDREWTLEHGDELRPIQDGDELIVAGVKWRVELPPLDDEELASTYQSQSREVDSELRLTFLVSGDGEHIHLSATTQGAGIDLGARAHNHPLLVLASLRILDQERGISDPEAGWTYPDDLERRLGLEREAMNLQLWRARQCFKRARLPAELLIERRDDTRQLRLGVPLLEVIPPERRLL